MGINEKSELAMMVCEEVLGRKLTPDEAKILGISFELGRQYGVEQVENNINGFD
jgi:hypothetical protein